MPAQHGPYLVQKAHDYPVDLVMAIIRHMRIKLGFLSVSRAFNNEILIQVFQNRVACPLSAKDNKEQRKKAHRLLEECTRHS